MASLSFSAVLPVGLIVLPSLPPLKCAPLSLLPAPSGVAVPGGRQGVMPSEMVCILPVLTRQSPRTIMQMSPPSLPSRSSVSYDFPQLSTPLCEDSDARGAVAPFRRLPHARWCPGLVDVAPCLLGVPVPSGKCCCSRQGYRSALVGFYAGQGYPYPVIGRHVWVDVPCLPCSPN